MLPNLLIIGAAKSGTTSLHEYLALHPEIAMSARKELRFFVKDDWRERISWYEAQFPEARVRGESSPSYSMFPFRPNVAERAHQLIPDAKLIYIVREPLERARAQYVEHVALTLEERTIAEALGALDDRANPYLCASRYATQLQLYLDLFDASQILVIDYQDLLERRLVVLDEIFSFLGVDPTFESPEFGRMHNTRREKVRYGALGVWLMKHRVLTERRNSFDRGPLVRPLRRLLSRPIDDALPSSTQELLVEVLRPEVDRLRELTGKTFPGWSPFPVGKRLEDSHVKVPST